MGTPLFHTECCFISLHFFRTLGSNLICPQITVFKKKIFANKFFREDVVLWEALLKYPPTSLKTRHKCMVAFRETISHHGILSIWFLKIVPYPNWARAHSVTLMQTEIWCRIAKRTRSPSFSTCAKRNKNHWSMTVCHAPLICSSSAPRSATEWNISRLVRSSTVTWPRGIFYWPPILSSRYVTLDWPNTIRNPTSPGTF